MLAMDDGIDHNLICSKRDKYTNAYMCASSKKYKSCDDRAF